MTGIHWLAVLLVCPVYRGLFIMSGPHPWSAVCFLSCPVSGSGSGPHMQPCTIATPRQGALYCTVFYASLIRPIQPTLHSVHLFSFMSPVSVFTDLTYLCLSLCFCCRARGRLFTWQPLLAVPPHVPSCWSRVLICMPRTRYLMQIQIHAAHIYIVYTRLQTTCDLKHTILYWETNIPLYICYASSLRYPLFLPTLFPCTTMTILRKFCHYPHWVFMYLCIHKYKSAFFSARILVHEHVHASGISRIYVREQDVVKLFLILFVNYEMLAQ